MPWRLDGLVEERVERCRALLAEAGGVHEGSADMAVFVEYADAIVALHRTALDDACRPRSNLTLREKLQLCTLFVLAISKHPLRSLGVEDAADRVLSQAVQSLPREWEPLRLAVMVCGETGPGEMGYETKFRCAEALTAMLADAEVAAQLPQRLAAAGSSHTLDAPTIVRIAHYRCVKAAERRCEEAQLAGLPLPPQAVADGRRMARRLVALSPDWPRYLLLQAGMELMAGDLQRATVAYRQALQHAMAKKAYYWAAQARIELAMAIMSGAEGPRFSVAEVSALLDAGERDFKTSRAWASVSLRHCLSDVAETRQTLQDCKRAGPRGATHLPASVGAQWAAIEQPPERFCSGCGQLAVELKKCSKCRAVAYCSRECQVVDWRGGHKQQCAILSQERQRA